MKPAQGPHKIVDAHSYANLMNLLVDTSFPGK
jgi:hypothetical protein